MELLWPVLTNSPGYTLLSFRYKYGHCFVYNSLQGLLATDLVISVNKGQVTRTTPELATPSPSFHITSTGGRLSLGRFVAHRSPLQGGSSAARGSNS
ncbi:hypothetical protein TNCV_1166741 [Trichonephila clavipes]|uniref:Uncharacterized protein n=1 Tax=Trichonephila clavipes TaxID=2585209 RepID=A0A8X6T0F0_TRICX|nr:hypothetical protein TNCV_1166741 [Trichonephila clavipes]